MDKEELKPVIFSITDETDLKKLYAFQNEHYRTCRKKYPDVSGALFVYEIIPTGLGTLFTVKCPCGKELTLDRDMV